MKSKFHINPNIAKSETLPAHFYRDQAVFDDLREKVFGTTWQWLGEGHFPDKEQNTYPFVLMEGNLDEPLLLTRNKENKIFCLSNVCTHRGNLVVNEPGKLKKLVCGYHGRRFSLEGQFEHMPEFREAEDFPRPCDHLHQLPLHHWGQFLFTALKPAFDFQEVIDTMNKRIGFMPIEEFRADPSRNMDYHINAHWALYCDNYLEGFHIPFVHEDLNEVLDYSNYETVIYPYLNLQIGYAEGTEEIFDFPADHMDAGKKIAAYYFWVFPNMMFNFYPWGLSVNIVEPLGINRTRVKFQSYVFDHDKLGKGAGSGLDKVEMEDEEVVEGVQKGIKSRFYKNGRFSPKREKGVHHFHQLLSQFLNA